MGNHHGTAAAAAATATAQMLFTALAFGQTPTLGRFNDGVLSGPRSVRTSLLPAAGTSEVEELTSSVVLRRAEPIEQIGRPTTPREHLIGELRRWRVLQPDWDGEGAKAPVRESLEAAAAFACILSDEVAGELPEPMLHASGRAGLFWHNANLYADLEFLADQRVAYYIERDGSKHKGVVTFNSHEMPAVFATLLPI
jgi:hypothetical protein